VLQLDYIHLNDPPPHVTCAARTAWSCKLQQTVSQVNSIQPQFTPLLPWWLPFLSCKTVDRSLVGIAEPYFSRSFSNSRERKRTKHWIKLTGSIRRWYVRRAGIRQTAHATAERATTLNTSGISSGPDNPTTLNTDRTFRLHLRVVTCRLFCPCDTV
jgi:hypothetical protein